MKPFGLTGNIGCGKSTVAGMLAKYDDVTLVDCDGLAKAVMGGGEYRLAISQALGCDAFASGAIDRKLIAKLIFNDPEKKRRLEAVVHPAVWTEVQAINGGLDDRRLCIVEAAIIYETGDEFRFAEMIVVACSAEEQRRRLFVDRHMDLVDLESRIRSQMPSGEKEKRAKFVINTDCDLAELEKRVAQLHVELKRLKGE